MKAKISLFVEFILLIILSTFVLADDSCPVTMRKTYVDDLSMVPYGSARSWYSSVCYFQWPGSLFFKRKVLIEPRFEVHLKASLEKVDTVETDDEQKVYGFTIVISGYKNTVSGYVSRSQHSSVFDDVGYNNFVNSLIFEFDFVKDKNDPDDSSFSVRYCDTTCTADDQYATFKAKLNSQQYNYLMNNNWDFRLVYANKKLTLYSGASQSIYSTSMSLEERLGTNIAFVGFTGFTFSNRREINLVGSFICEDNYEIKLMPGNFYINEQKLDTATYQAGAEMNYIFSFINNQNNLVPHTYGYDIWNYTFGIISDCGDATYLMTKETNYTLIFNTKACTKVGKHPIHILEKIKGNAPDRYYTVVAGPMKKIYLIGHDGIIGPVPNITNLSTIILTYGDAATGDFVYKPNLKLVLDFAITDEYGNVVEVSSPNTLFSLKKVSNSGEISAVAANIISYTMKKVDTHYQMTLSVNKLGTYQIENTNYMKESIRFSVIPGEVDLNQSYCTLDGYSSPPVIEKGKTVLYNCYLKDSIGTEITTEIFLQKSAYTFYCATERSSSNSKANFTNKVNDKVTYYSCEVPATDAGSYEVNGYLLSKKSSESLKIKPKVNQFTVGANLSLKKVFDLYNKNWLDINGAIITFTNETASLITAVDLFDEDGKALISSYGKYPNSFDIKTLTAVLYSEVDYNKTFTQVLPQFLEMDGKQYIGIYTKDGKNADTIIKKLYFDYKIKFTLKKVSGVEEKIVTLKDIIDDSHGNGPYVIEKCILKPKNTSFVAGNYETFTLELRTKDNLLYNDDIDISKDIEIKIDKEDKSFNSTVKKSGSDYGIYTITIYSEKKGKYVMDVLLADPAKDKKEKKNAGPAYYTVYPDKVPFKKYTVISVQPPKEVNLNDTLEFRFTLSDKFDNLFEERHDCVDEPYLSLVSNGEPLPVINLTLLPDEKTYVIYAYPKYPPKTMSINVIYDDGENRVDCFPENINITIRIEIDFLQTQIVSSNKELIHVGEILDMWLYTFDKEGNCFNEDYSSYYKIHVTGPLNSTKLFNKTYSVKKIDHPDNDCNNEYQIITTEKDKYTIAGNYIIRVNGNDTQIAKYDQVCLALGYEEFLLYYDFDPDHISILDNFQFSVSGEDSYGNKIDEPLYDDMTINFTQNDTYTPFESSKIEKKVGNLTFDVGIRKVGPHQLHLYYKGKEVLTVNHGQKLPIFTIIPGPCRAETNEHFNLTPTENAELNVKTYFSFQCYDIYGNKITKGGEIFTANGKLVLETVDNIPVETEVIDNNDGTYNVEFVPDMHGTYVFDLVVDKEKYGEPVKVEITKKICSGATSILCPNENKCVGNIQDCIVPQNGCPLETPFKCKVNGTETCTKSQIDCDCPEGFIRCEIMKYCVPENRPDMCPAFKKTKSACSKYGSNYQIFYDGICRPIDYHGPNQRVCPIGQVLCADLSCRDTYYDCVVTEVRESNKVRCLGQAIVGYDYLCPSSFTCNNEEDVVCSDGTCVSNEIYCPALPKCPKESPYRCQNNQCALDYTQCSQSIACGHTQSLCSDNICREKCDA